MNNLKAIAWLDHVYIVGEHSLFVVEEDGLLINGQLKFNYTHHHAIFQRLETDEIFKNSIKAITRGTLNSFLINDSVKVLDLAASLLAVSIGNKDEEEPKKTANG